MCPRERKCRAAAYAAFATMDAKGIQWRAGKYNDLVVSYIMRTIREQVTREQVEVWVEAEREIFANWTDWLSAGMPLD